MSDAELLNAWDAAKAARPASRVLILIARLGAAKDIGAAADLPVGVRDGIVLELRRHLFGRRLELVATCPHCGEKVEFEPDAANLTDLALQAVSASEPWPVSVPVGDVVLTCRRPTTRDLRAAADGASMAARRRLFEACIVEATRAGTAVPIEALDEEIVAGLAAALAVLDPAADIRFGLACPVCAGTWEALFDPPHLLWSEIDNWALGRIDEVRRLAAAFGWAERDILAMSAARRRLYLEAL
jgi:hypothetical protein